MLKTSSLDNPDFVLVGRRRPRRPTSNRYFTQIFYKDPAISIEISHQEGNLRFIVKSCSVEVILTYCEQDI